MYGLYLLDQILRRSNREINQFAGMPAVTGDWQVDVPENRLLHAQRNYDVEELAARVAHNTHLFNVQQQQVYDAAMDTINHNRGQLLFIQSAGGCGKTFVCNTIAAAVRAQGKIALCVASSGIAALLLEGGRTAHSTFRIPICLDEASTCSIRRGSETHQVLEQTAVIIWDEVPMQHKHAVDAVDRTLRDLLRKPTLPFAGITVIFGGDFRQTLPVIPRGTRQQIISASLRRSSLWPHIKVHRLEQNMRLEQTAENVAHADWLLEIGGGRTVDDREQITIPEQMICADNSIDNIINFTYPDIEVGGHDDQYYLDRTLLSCTNDDVDNNNAMILARFPGVEKVLLSADTVESEEADFQPYPTEYLNSLKAGGLPLAKLALKVGCPVMLLRNLDPLIGLCNGTRLIVMEIGERVLKCRIISGDRKFAGNIVFIPRISLTPSAENLLIPLRRHQFPVRLAFCMTINKSQGQSVKRVGLDLRSPVFSHGQLYVALSRCTSANRIKVLLNEQNVDRKTANIVYREILSGIA